MPKLMVGLRTRRPAPSGATRLVRPGGRRIFPLRPCCFRPRTPRALADVEEALARAGMWGPVSWPDPHAGPGAPPWPIVVTAPTDEPGRVDELVGVIDAALGGG